MAVANCCGLFTGQMIFLEMNRKQLLIGYLLPDIYIYTVYIYKYICNQGYELSLASWQP